MHFWYYYNNNRPICVVLNIYIYTYIFFNAGIALIKIVYWLNAINQFYMKYNTMCHGHCKLYCNIVSWSTSDLFATVVILHLVTTCSDTRMKMQIEQELQIQQTAISPPNPLFLTEKPFRPEDKQSLKLPGNETQKRNAKKSCVTKERRKHLLVLNLAFVCKWSSLKRFEHFTKWLAPLIYTTQSCRHV